MKKNKLKAFSLNNLLIALAITGILTIAAFPLYDNLVTKAYATEAEANLQHIKNLEDVYKLKNFSYTTDLKEITFQSPVLKKNGGNALFEYEVIEASKTSFVARAKAAEDFNGDGKYMEVVISEKGKIETKVED